MFSFYDQNSAWYAKPTVIIKFYETFSKSKFDPYL